MSEDFKFKLRLIATAILFAVAAWISLFDLSSANNIVLAVHIFGVFSAVMVGFCIGELLQ